MNKRIEICGGIAAGKTSLAKVLEEEGFTAVYERFNDNPFLTEFYASSEVENTLETEIVFVLLHYNLIKRKMNNHAIVCDYSFLQDYCYSENNLDKDEKDAFNYLYDFIIKQISQADLIIYLKCNVDCLLERIRERGREMENSITKEYLQSNIDVLEKRLNSEKNVLVIESDKYNFLSKDRDMVIKMIQNYRSESKN